MPSYSDGLAASFGKYKKTIHERAAMRAPQRWTAIPPQAGTPVGTKAFGRSDAIAVTALLPPTEWKAWASRHPRLLAALARWERRLETVPPLPWLADHYLLELERR